MRKLAHVIAFDDMPFPRVHRGDVGIVGVVYAGARFDGVVAGPASAATARTPRASWPG